LGGHWVTSQPIGVVAAITPWNYPQALVAMKIASALAAGCTVVLKPAPETGLDAFAFADAALEVGFAAGRHQRGARRPGGRCVPRRTPDGR
jgi:aldehyde dehydrogenase (NAD+)